ncbi:MAG: hypothetical protein WC333_09560 [Dehalococcoidia bacterium]|jgi:hypothetical protein
MSHVIQVVGYQPRQGTPLDDYSDFPIGQVFSLEDVDKMTDLGHFPPGIILQAKGGKPCVVRGHYFDTQYVEVL